MATASRTGHYLSGYANGVEIHGALPDRPGRPRLLLLFANTATERRILQTWLDETLAGKDEKATPRIAWFSDHKTGDNLQHDGLVDALTQSQTLDIVPIGVVWKPKTQEQQSWVSIHRWMRLVDSNRLQKTTVRRDPERVAVVIAEFGTLKALQAKYDRMAAKAMAPAHTDVEALANFVALEAAITIERDSRIATGETIKYPRHVARSIWGRPMFQALLAEIAEESGRPLSEVQDEARACLKELVPRVRAPHVSLSGAFARKVCGLGYDKDLVYDRKRMKEIRELALTRPTAIMWTHKTHIDGFAILLSTQNENFPLVHIIGGNNMAFFGVGYLMSRAGTIFIRRKMESKVYKAVLRFYLSWLLEKRFPVTWALEGTRSRNGKLMPPRFGILKYVVEAAARENMRNLTLVPVSIYYDQIAELGDYAREQSGTTKQRESIRWFMGYLQSLRKPLGRISLGIGDTIEIDTTTDYFKSALDGDGDQFSIELQKLAFDASVKANDVTPLTPTSLYSLVLTGAAPQALTEAESQRETMALLKWAKTRKLPMTDELRDMDQARLKEIADSMLETGVISRFDEGLESVFSIAEGKHFEASYYRNNAIHLFVDKALIELAMYRTSKLAKAASVDAFWAEVKYVRDTFKYEFFYPEWAEHQPRLEAELNRALSDWRQRLAAGDATTLLRDLSPLVCHAVLRPFIEAYRVVAEVMSHSDGTDKLDEKAVVDGALKLGKQAFLQRKITSEESIGKLMFSNGYQLAVNRGLAPGGKDDLYAARMGYLEELSDVTQQLKDIRQIADDLRRTPGPKSSRRSLKAVSNS